MRSREKLHVEEIAAAKMFAHAHSRICSRTHQCECAYMQVRSDANAHVRAHMCVCSKIRKHMEAHFAYARADMHVCTAHAQKKRCTCAKHGCMRKHQIFAGGGISVYSTFTTRPGMREPYLKSPDTTVRSGPCGNGCPPQLLFLSCVASPCFPIWHNWL